VEVACEWSPMYLEVVNEGSALFVGEANEWSSMSLFGVDQFIHCLWRIPMSDID